MIKYEIIDNFINVSDFEQLEDYIMPHGHTKRPINAQVKLNNVPWNFHLNESVEGEELEHLKEVTDIDQLNQEIATPVEEKSHNVVGNTEVINEVNNTMYETTGEKVDDLVTKLFDKQMGGFLGSVNARNFIKGELEQMWKPGGHKGGTAGNPSTLTGNEYDQAIKVLDEMIANHALKTRDKHNKTLQMQDKAEQMSELAALLGGDSSGQSIEKETYKSYLLQ